MFEDMFNEVKEYFSKQGEEGAKGCKFPFRKRSEHIWRVFHWAKRLIDEGEFGVGVDRDSVLIAALFHDVGYTLSYDNSHHAENSAIIFQRYVQNKDREIKRQDFITYLIRNHSNKELLENDDTPLELVILMEADLLDETGALSIVWDCMMEGGQSEQSFVKTYRHIKSYSGKTLDENPMKTKKAREIWANKQKLMKEFLNQLAYDLAIHE